MKNSFYLNFCEYSLSDIPIIAEEVCSLPRGFTQSLSLDLESRISESSPIALQRQKLKATGVQQQLGKNGYILEIVEMKHLTAVELTL